MSLRIIISLAICTSFLFSCKNLRQAAQHGDSSTRIRGASNSSIQKKYASILGVSTAQIENIKLYEFIDEWYGVPYKYGGQSKSGVDCSGFINALYSDVYNKMIPRTASAIADEAKSISKSRINEGDIVIFNIQGKKHSHVGVYLLNGKFVHASSSKGLIISDLNTPYYQKAYSQAGRF